MLFQFLNVHAGIDQLECHQQQQHADRQDYPKDFSGSVGIFIHIRFPPDEAGEGIDKQPARKCPCQGFPIRSAVFAPGHAHDCAHQGGAQAANQQQPEEKRVSRIAVPGGVVGLRAVPVFSNTGPKLFELRQNHGADGETESRRHLLDGRDIAEVAPRPDFTGYDEEVPDEPEPRQYQQQDPLSIRRTFRTCSPSGGHHGRQRVGNYHPRAEESRGDRDVDVLK